MEQMPTEIPTVLLYSGESIGTPMKQPGNGTRPRGLLAGVENVKGEGGDKLLPCMQVMLMLA